LLCIQLNGDIAEIVSACKQIANVEVETPVVVGVDQLGVDVRARFGIVRLESDAPLTNIGEVLTFMKQIP
jgi:hypothetical protein